jgi:hypothetical protein
MTDLKTAWRLAALVLLLATPALHAEPTYNYFFDRSVYAVAPGQTFSVNASLEEQAAPGEARLVTEGLSSAGVRLAAVPELPDNLPPPAQPATPVSAQPGAGFNGGFVVGHAGLAMTLLEAVAPGSSVHGEWSDSAGGYAVHLGTVQVTAGLREGDNTRLILSDVSALDETVTAKTGMVLDGKIQTAEAVVAVHPACVVAPEPSAMWLMLSGAAGLLWRWRANAHAAKRTLE